MLILSFFVNFSSIFYNNFFFYLLSAPYPTPSLFVAPIYFLSRTLIMSQFLSNIPDLNCFLVPTCDLQQCSFQYRNLVSMTPKQTALQLIMLVPRKDVFFYICKSPQGFCYPLDFGLLLLSAHKLLVAF